jgi:hypothetical protein
MIVLLSAAPASGYELLRVNDNPCAREDRHVSWPGASVAVNIGQLPGSLSALADEARQRWNFSLSRFRFGLGGGNPCRLDGVATLAVSATPCDQSDFGQDTVAITRALWRSDGELVDADITFRAGSFILEDQAIFLEVAMHELGHVLGLDHSDACGGSGAGTLMKSFLTSERLAAPQTDDIDGAEFIYPSGSGGGGTVPEGANSCAVTSPGAVRPALAWLFVPALLLLRRARRRLTGR